MRADSAARDGRQQPLGYPQRNPYPELVAEMFLICPGHRDTLTELAAGPSGILMTTTGRRSCSTITSRPSSRTRARTAWIAGELGFRKAEGHLVLDLRRIFQLAAFSITTCC